MKSARKEPAAGPQQEQPVPIKGLQGIRAVHDILKPAIAVWLKARNEQLWNATGADPAVQILAGIAKETTSCDNAGPAGALASEAPQGESMIDNRMAQKLRRIAGEHASEVMTVPLKDIKRRVAEWW